jgi:hypothetical protein
MSIRSGDGQPYFAQGHKASALQQQFEHRRVV